MFRDILELLKTWEVMVFAVLEAAMLGLIGLGALIGLVFLACLPYLILGGAIYLGFVAQAGRS